MDAKPSTLVTAKDRGPAIRRPKDAVREEKAVTLRGLHEEVLFRSGHLVDQGPERVAKPIHLLRIVRIHTGDVTAELRSAGPAGFIAVLAQLNARACEGSIDLPKRNRR